MRYAPAFHCYKIYIFIINSYILHARAIVDILLFSIYMLPLLDPSLFCICEFALLLFLRRSYHKYICNAKIKRKKIRRRKVGIHIHTQSLYGRSSVTHIYAYARLTRSQQTLERRTCVCVSYKPPPTLFKLNYIINLRTTRRDKSPAVRPPVKNPPNVLFCPFR